MDTTQLLKGVLDVAVLAAVQHEDGYGYDIVRRLRSAGLDEIGDASVYGTLRRLYSAGALTSYVVPSDGGPHRKYYGINDQGRSMLAEQRDSWTTFAQTMGGLLAPARPAHVGAAQNRHPAQSARSERTHDHDHTSRNEVTEFATAVRAALSDLPPDERDELTDGLEADLSERLDEASDDSPGFGDPVAYAEELRAAAGYPPRAAMPKLRTLPQKVRAGWTALVGRHAWLASVLAFLAVLRPVWWVLRGVAAHAILASLLGVSGTALWFVGVAMVVLSVQVGRGRMQHRTWVRWTTHAVSAIVILFAPFLLGAAATAVNLAMSTSPYEEPYSYPGLSQSGQQIDNIFAYDASGNPIDQVQLFDQDGNPLNLVGDTSADFWGTMSGGMVVPSSDVPGRAGWNVFPLDHANSWSDYEDDWGARRQEISQSPFPALQVKPLSGYGAEPAVLAE